VMARVKRELRRVGAIRFLDVLAFRLYYRFFRARRDSEWLRRRIEALSLRYPSVPPTTEILVTSDPNSAEVEQFLHRLAPDLTLARCKRLLRERIFSAPSLGTFVLHPGICPEYRNAHGAFWAIVNDDRDRVGLTLLKIDRGVDTGPVYGYYSYAFDARAESHIMIMNRMVLENLDAIRDRFLEIREARAVPIDTLGRRSAVWGQPWLSRHVRWMWHSRNAQPRA
jgi:methionyl-tRNA formyltransferase